MKFLSSFKITIFSFFLTIVLLFIGTLYQAKYGMEAAQNNVFRAFFVYWQPYLPIFPGGFSIAVVFLLNLIASIFYRFNLSFKKLGVYLFHLGFILFVLGEFLSAFLSSETTLTVKNNQKTDYSLKLRESEIVVADLTNNRNWIFSEKDIDNGNILEHFDLPFTLLVKNKISNASISPDSNIDNNSNIATVGLGIDKAVIEKPLSYGDNDFNYLTAWVEVLDSRRSRGIYLLTTAIEEEQTFDYLGLQYSIVLRPKRKIFPFQVELSKFEYENYPGTEIPKSISSYVNFFTKDGKKDRSALISMNAPFKYRGITFYQQGFDLDENVSILKAVENPAWTVIYLSSTLVILGLLFHFFIRFFVKAR